MRIVITGATGNIGTALLRRLDEHEHQLTGVARRPPRTAGGHGLVSWVAADLTRDADVPTLREAFSGADAVVHLAWGFQPSHRLDYLEELGVGGTSRVLDAVAEARVPHLVHMSSVGAYSPKGDDAPVDESYPTGGVPTSPYSRHKSTAERLLDDFEQQHPEVTVARLRPGIVGQTAAGSALLRYALPAPVPAAAVRLLPLLPLDGRMRIPVVHSDDVADAIARALAKRAEGAFNLAAEPVITAGHIAEALGARHVQVPSGVVRAAVNAAWRARLQPVDPGWIDLAYAVPTLDTSRAREALGWAPTRDAVSVLREIVAGMTGAASGPTPVLRPRRVGEELGRTALRGPVSSRRLP